MSFRETKKPSHRKMSPADFVGRWQHGNVLLGIRATVNADGWRNYCIKWGIKLDDAAQRMRLAQFLAYDVNRIWQIALLQLPYDVIVRVCSERYTEEQRERWFALYSPPQSNDDLVSQLQAWIDFKAIVSPPLHHANNGHMTQLFVDEAIKEEDAIPAQGTSIETLVEKAANIEFAFNTISTAFTEFRQALKGLISKQG